jgi:hypothetical protein
MENGVLPTGPSHRVYPRLYRARGQTYETLAIGRTLALQLWNFPS